MSRLVKKDSKSSCRSTKKIPVTPEKKSDKNKLIRQRKQVRIGGTNLMKSYSSGVEGAFSAIIVKGKAPVVPRPPSNTKAIKLDKHTTDGRGSTELRKLPSPNGRMKFVMSPPNSNGDHEIQHITRKHSLEADPEDEDNPFSKTPVHEEDLKKSAKRIESPFERLLTPLEDFPFGSKDNDKEEESPDIFLGDGFLNQLDNECFTRATIRVLEQQEKEIQDKLKKEKQKLLNNAKRRKKNLTKHSSGGGGGSSSNNLIDIINKLKF
jgi:hypothetical protein